MNYVLREGVRISPLAEWGVAYVFVRPTNRLWILNRTAWYVLESLTGGVAKSDLIDEMCVDFGLTPKRAAAEIGAIVGLFESQCMIQPTS